MIRLSRKDFLQKTLGITLLASAYPALYLLDSHRKKRHPKDKNHFDPTYAKAYYKWYQRTFFNFDQNFTKNEQNFVQACMSLMKEWSFELEDQIHISLLAFSHKVSTKSVNSSRLAVGSIEFAEILQDKIASILQERNIRLKDISMWGKIHGLAWDFAHKELKLYSFNKDILSQRTKSFESLACDINPKLYHSFGIEALSYRGNKFYEKKIYLYPKAILEDPELPSFLLPAVIHSTEMYSEKRGRVIQSDLDYEKVRQSDFLPKIQKILAKNQSNHWPLDTISYMNNEQVTLYF